MIAQIEAETEPDPVVTLAETTDDYGNDKSNVAGGHRDTRVSSSKSTNTCINNSLEVPTEACKRIWESWVSRASFRNCGTKRPGDMLDDLTEKMKSCDLGKNLKMGEEDLEQKKERDAKPTNANADEPADVCVKNG